MLTTTKEVKAKLVPIFGKTNVSVTRGKGTAYGWIHADVDIDRPLADDCTCTDGVPYCSSCRGALRIAAGQILDAVAGLKFSSYYSDDGSSTPHDCFLHQVHFKKVDAVVNS